LEDDFKKCVNHTVTPAEFEAQWMAMMSKYGLQANGHFQRLYAIRSSFVLAQFMHCFFPFLQSTQRSEGFNAVLKKYVNPNMSILNFVRQYEKIQEMSHPTFRRKPSAYLYACQDQVSCI
jgi:hypothetical protein